MEDQKIITGDVKFDDRGFVKFFNDFNFAANKIRRMYQVSNRNCESRRWWHGHERENKWFYVPQGLIKIIMVKCDISSCCEQYKNNYPPIPFEESFCYWLSGFKSEILHVPSGHFHSFENIINSQVICFSDLSVEESKSDDYRIPIAWWAELWEKKNG